MNIPDINKHRNSQILDECPLQMIAYFYIFQNFLLKYNIYEESGHDSILMRKLF